MSVVFSKEFLISSYHLNPRKQARLTTLANFFQEMAYQHANQLGFGYRDLKKNKNMWVLSRMKIRVDRYPLWDDTVVVETWHRGMHRLFGMRDFRVRDQQGMVMAVATTAWLIVDMDTRRPVRPDDRTLHESRGEEAVLGESMDKLMLPDKLDELGIREVVHSDLDIVGHVNNVKYIEWCIDKAVPQSIPGSEIHEFEINFMHEALPGDRIMIKGKLQQASDSFFVAERTDGAQEIFRARLRWKD
jgi:acyl-ACP thioesterase